MKNFLCITLAMIGMTFAIAQTPNYQGIVYVTPTGAGTHSGDSWANASSSLDSAQVLARDTTVWCGWQPASIMGTP
ncbi:MAG: hypothetical protein IJT04_02375 [Bacteroidales bacterium]|nr:hypothetical protein [Bacteroidales bacterium]MBQ9508484.1 hypothetical protein [Bacteroidales bacterium]